MNAAGPHAPIETAGLPRWPTLVLACVAQFMVILDLSIVNVALPSIRTGLDFSQQNLQWVVNAYTLGFAGFLLLGGRAADLLGRRRVFVGGLIVLSVASLIGGLAQSQGMLIAARAGQGLAAAVVAPATLTILTTTFREGSERNRALSAWGAMGGVGGTTGALLGGVLTDLVGWRWILFINVPIGLATAALALRYVAEGRNPGQARHFDLPGAATITLGLVALVFGVVRTDVVGWGSPQTIGAMAAGIALIAAFLVIEGRFAPAPLMPLRIFGSRTLTGANLVAFLLGAASFAMWFFVSLYLQQGLGYSPLRAGLAFMPMTVSIVICSVLASRAVARFGVKPMLAAGMLAQAAGLVLFATASANGSYQGDVLLPSLLAAGGFGLALVPMTIAAMGGVAPREAGLASGLVNTSRQMGGALGLAILATLATAQTHHALAARPGGGQALRDALIDGFHRAFAIGAGFAVAGLLVALIVLRRPRPHVQPVVTPEPAAAESTT